MSDSEKLKVVTIVAVISFAAFITPKLAVLCIMGFLIYPIYKKIRDHS